jgi:hypothetical protein
MTGISSAAETGAAEVIQGALSGQKGNIGFDL